MGGNIEGNLGGTVEAWPFLDGLARFLGNVVMSCAKGM